MLIENGKAVLRTDAGALKLVPEGQAEEAKKRFGWADATADDVAADDLQKKKGGALGAAESALVSVGRPIASGAAAVARGLSSLGGEVDAMGNPVEVTAPALDVKGEDLAPGLYNESADAAVAANPTAAAVGRTVPTVAAGLAAGALTGGAGLPAVLAAEAGVGALAGAADEALDAELEQRGVSAEKLLYNAGLGAALGAGSVGMMAGAARGARSLARAGRNAVEFAADSAKELRNAGGFLETKLVPRAAKIVEESAEEVPTAARLAKNGNAQREAIGNLTYQYRGLEEQLSGSLPQKYRQLADMAEGVASGTGLGDDIAKVLDNRAVWGDAAVNRLSATRELAAMTPAPTQEFAQALRAAGKTKAGSELQKTLDRIDAVKGNAALDGILPSLRGRVAGKAAEYAVRAGAQAVGSVVPGVGNFLAGVIAEPLAARAGKAAAKAFGAAGAGAAVLAAASPAVASMEELQAAHRHDIDRTALALVSLEPPVDEDPGDDATARFRGEHQDAQQAYRELQDMLRDPALIADAVAEELEGLPPGLSAKMGAQAMRSIAFLQSRAQPMRGVSVARPQGTPASPLQVRTFGLYVTAALDPKSVLRDARHGRLRREQVETLREVWPETYADLRTAVVDALGSGSSTVTRQRMTLLFDLGAGVDPALGPGVTRAVNAARQRQASPAQAPGTSRARLPSTQADLPAGAASLQLGPSLDR